MCAVPSSCSPPVKPPGAFAVFSSHSFIQASCVNPLYIYENLSPCLLSAHTTCFSKNPTGEQITSERECLEVSKQNCSSTEPGIMNTTTYLHTQTLLTVVVGIWASFSADALQRGPCVIMFACAFFQLEAPEKPLFIYKLAPGPVELNSSHTSLHWFQEEREERGRLRCLGI